MSSNYIDPGAGSGPNTQVQSNSGDGGAPPQPKAPDNRNVHPAQGKDNYRNKRNRRNRNRQNNDRGPKVPLPPPEYPVYKEVQLQKLKVSELQSIAKIEGVRHYRSTPRRQLVVETVKQQLRRGAAVKVRGILELTPENHGYLRNEDSHLSAQYSDPFIPVQIIRQYDLYAGLQVTGMLRNPRSGDKHLVISDILEVEGRPPEELKQRKQYEQLTALFPEERLLMEIPDSKSEDMTRRVIDLVAPLGKGQRGLIVAPPRVGKTIMLKQMVQSIEHNHPDVKVIVLLIDERPEEVTDMMESIRGHVVASTFDEPPERHNQVANTALARAKVLVENGEDVVLFLDSITRLTRAFNAGVSNANSRTMSGGIDSGALQKTKRFFGTARNIEDGGSLTILGTALVQTGSRMDDVIFEEFKGTGNMEIILDRELANSRIYPAIHCHMSGTRKDDLLLVPDEFALVQKIRKTLNSMPYQDAISHLLQQLRRFGTNAEFLMHIKNAINA